MVPTKHAAAAFLACRRIAVTGASRDPSGHGSNAVLQRLRERGYDVVAINPNADEIAGVPCYHRLQDVPGSVEAVVIGTRPERVGDTMRDVVELGISKVWMHRAFGQGSVDAAATEYGRKHGVVVIDGGCPLMFEPTADPLHKILRVCCGKKVPRRV